MGNKEAHKKYRQSEKFKAADERRKAKQRAKRKAAQRAKPRKFSFDEAVLARPPQSAKEIAAEITRNSEKGRAQMKEIEADRQREREAKELARANPTILNEEVEPITRAANASPLEKFTAQIEGLNANAPVPYTLEEKHAVAALLELMRAGREDREAEASKHVEEVKKLTLRRQEALAKQRQLTEEEKQAEAERLRKMSEAATNLEIARHIRETEERMREEALRRVEAEEKRKRAEVEYANWKLRNAGSKEAERKAEEEKAKQREAQRADNIKRLIGIVDRFLSDDDLPNMLRKADTRDVERERIDEALENLMVRAGSLRSGR